MPWRNCINFTRVKVLLAYRAEKASWFGRQSLYFSPPGRSLFSVASPDQIPDFQTLMLPVLRFASGKEMFKKEEASVTIADEFGLTADQRQARLASGQAVVNNRVGWALSYMKMAGLVTSPVRGTFAITERGKEALASKPERIDMKFLRRYPEYVTWRHGETKTLKNEIVENVMAQTSATPQEAIEGSIQQIENDLIANILEQIRAKVDDSSFLEKLVVGLLLKMGYGGLFEEAGEVVGRTGDGGIDGVIKQDRLGLEKIYVQAKNWKANVGRPDLNQFIGSLAGKRARKGVFVTTGGFTSEALEYGEGMNESLVLINGHRLAQLMIEYGIGVVVQDTYQVKKIDEDYFSE